MFDELFNSTTIPYYILSFDQENYTKYIEMLYKYTNKFSTFTDEFRADLLKIINAIYPIGGNSSPRNSYKTSKKKNSFGLFSKKSGGSYRNSNENVYEKEVK